MNGARLVTGPGGRAGCMDRPVSGASGAPLDVAACDAAVRSIGCELATGSEYGAVEFQAGRTREDVVTITRGRPNREQALRVENGGVRPTKGACVA